MDTWHGILIGAISTLSGTVVALWRQNNSLHTKLDSQAENHRAEMNDLHEEHKADIRELTQAALELGTAVSARAQLPRGCDTLPPNSED